MRSDNSDGLNSSIKLNKKQRQGSYSPRLSTSFSQKSLWTLSYKNQPVPDQIRRRLLFKSRKPAFDKQSEGEENFMPVEEVDQNDIHQKKISKLSRYQIVGDWDEFSERRNRIRSEKHAKSERCRSVQPLKLPQVIQEKKQEDDLHKLGLSKLCQIMDQNQFNQKTILRSATSFTDAPSRVESLELTKMASSQLPQQIPEMEAEQGKEVAEQPLEKSLIVAQLKKIIVDEIDDKKKRKQDMNEEIQCIIEEKNQQQIDTQKLRRSLGKFDQQCQYLKSHADQLPGNSSKAEQIDEIEVQETTSIPGSIEEEGNEQQEK